MDCYDPERASGGTDDGGTHEPQVLRLPWKTFLALPLQGVSAVAVTSGANMNFDRLRLVTELADVGATREAMLATTIPERPGSFADFIDAALPDGSGLQITEFKYRSDGALSRGFQSCRMHMR